MKSLFRFPFVRMFTVAANLLMNGRLCVACDRALWELQEEACNALPSSFKLDIADYLGRRDEVSAPSHAAA